MSETGGQHLRTSDYVLGRLERRALVAMAGRLPAWVMPDHLTLLGVLGSTLVAVGYMLSNRNEHWLWLASAALVLNWFGDSLDGTLARVRRTERPRYGYYLDHLTDAYSTLCVGLGLGLSPYMLLSVGLAVVIAYFILSINVYLETHVFREFSFSYGRLGPTEVRLVLIALNTLALLWGRVPFHVFDIGETLFDVFGVLGVLGMLALLGGRAARNLRTLALEEPPGGRR